MNWVHNRKKREHTKHIRIPLMYRQAHMRTKARKGCSTFYKQCTDQQAESGYYEYAASVTYGICLNSIL